MSEDKQIDKKFGGTIRNWQLHTIAEPGTETMEHLNEQSPDMVTDKGYIFTGTVVEDPLGRWQPGFCMKSSLVLRVDRENGIIETRNTIYKVQDEGDCWSGGDLGRSAMSIYF